MNLAVARMAITALRWWLAAAADDPLGPVDQDPDQVRDDACDIVATDPSVCDPVDPGGSGGGGDGLQLDFLSLLLWALLIGAVCLLVGVVVRAAMRSNLFAGRRRKRRGGSAVDHEGDEIERGAVAVDRSREPVDWRAEADAHRAAGRFREALRCRYRALVGDLARRGLIDEIPGRTTGEERTQLRRVRPQAASPFDAAADLFDDAWYGHVDVGVGDDDRFRTLEHDVLAGTGERT